MKKIIIISAAAFMALLVGASIWFMPVCLEEGMEFTEDKTIGINNPMQGFYMQTDTADAPYAMAGIKSGGMSLALLACNLNGYQEKPLDDLKISEIKQAFEAAKTEKVDIIFRAAYGFAEGLDTQEPHSPDIVFGHIAQISEAIKPYSDILLCVQAGLIGPWGEWHTSSLLNGHGDKEQIQIKNAVVKAWIDGLPDEHVIIQLRRPEFVRQAVEEGIPVERLGFHNDALLADDSDMGTYWGDEGIRRKELEWANKNLPFSHFGGEMPGISAYTEPAAAAEEFKTLRLTYLNSGYNTEVLNDWRNKQFNGENAYDYIKNHMGSRLFIKEVSAKKGLFKLGRLKMNITLQNTGFAISHPALKFWIAVKQGASISYIPVDAISSQAEDNSINITVSVKMPDIDSGKSFSVGLRACFGTPSDGRPFLLANHDLEVSEDTVYFAEYEPHPVLWRIKA